MKLKTDMEPDNAACPSIHEGARYVTEVGPNDVLLGRGNPVIKNPGNVAFRELVLTRKQEYTQAKRVKSKDEIARQIIDEIANRNGKFLRKIESPAEAKKLGVPEEKVAHTWTIAKDDVILEKVKQALREKHTKKDSDGNSSEETDEEKDEGRKKLIKIQNSADGLIDGASLASNLSKEREQNRQLLALLEEQQILRAREEANAASYLTQQPLITGIVRDMLSSLSAPQSSKPLNAFGLGSNLGPIPNLILPQTNPATDILSLLQQQEMESLLSRALLNNNLSSLRLPRNTAGMQTVPVNYNSQQSSVAPQDGSLAQQLREYLLRTGAYNQSNNSASAPEDDRKPKASAKSEHFEQPGKSQRELGVNPSVDTEAQKKSPYNKKRRTSGS